MPPDCHQGVEVNYYIECVISCYFHVCLYTRTGTDSCFGLVLGSHKGYPEAKLLFRAVGMAEDGDTYSFSRNTSIQVQDIQTKANITFIETDKPIYKAGDTGDLINPGTRAGQKF